MKAALTFRLLVGTNMSPSMSAPASYAINALVALDRPHTFTRGRPAALSVWAVERTVVEVAAGSVS